jgi:hypothetical protein
MKIEQKIRILQKIGASATHTTIIFQLEKEAAIWKMAALVYAPGREFRL